MWRIIKTVIFIVGAQRLLGYKFVRKMLAKRISKALLPHFE
jgi:hypothetical protein